MLKLKLADYSTGQVSVYLVDGQYIRDNIFIDFTEGGNWLRYDFIPANEIWLGAVHIIECPYVLIHEMIEVAYAIQNGLDLKNDEDYDQAHNYANECEAAARKAPNTLDDALEEASAGLNNLLSTPVEEEKTIWTRP